MKRACVRTREFTTFKEFPRAREHGTSGSRRYFAMELQSDIKKRKELREILREGERSKEGIQTRYDGWNDDNEIWSIIELSKVEF